MGQTSAMSEINKLTIAVLSPGEMGCAIGRVLVSAGHRVTGCSAGRSDETRNRLQQAGIVDLKSTAALVAEADILLSIVPPHAAVAVAEEVAVALDGCDPSLVYVDCNAIAPVTTQAVLRSVSAAGAKPVDAGIIGPPPGRGIPTILYVSGPFTDALSGLTTEQLSIRQAGPDLGQASALKMLYSAYRKGANALYIRALMAAAQLGLFETLDAAFAESQTVMHETMRRLIPNLPFDALRWASEMREIQKTFSAANLPEEFAKGSADLYSTAAASQKAQSARGSADQNWNVREIIDELIEIEQSSDGVSN